MQPEKTPKHSPWAAVVHMFVHSIAGMAIFAIIAVPAIGLNYLIKYLEREGADPVVLAVLTVLEYSILIGDALLYLALLGKSLWKAAKELEL